MRTLVVGAGSMGRWVAETLGSDVALADADRSVAESAAAAVGGRAVDLDGTESFDVVCIAVPMPAAAEAVADQAHRAERAIVDVVGEMAGPIAAMRRHAPDLERVSFHPLFAPSNAPGTIALVPDDPGPATDEFRDALAAAGNDLFETTPSEHDRAMETVQASAHAAVLAYGLASESVDERFHTPVSAALDGLVEQVTDGDARVYADIQSRFDGADDLAAAARRVADADCEEFTALYERIRDGHREDRTDED
ncbi:prephenate dehydrogenase [Haloarchaeobius sp. HRN-SO-5]|uniref:prephenate dehydrogenase n=1 Tax=Haloarchaeobius sp. HRN-SO-5 TaxID=3446118 RepID=UPI003EB9267B